MYSEAKKLHLIEEVLKISNEATLTGLENFIKKSNISMQYEMTLITIDKHFNEVEGLLINSW